MAHIRKVWRKPRNGRARHAWEVTYRDPLTRKSKSQTFGKRTDADDFASTVEADKLRGLWTDPKRGRMTVGEWAERWFATKVDLRPTSLNRLRGLIDTHVVAAFGKATLDSITNAAVRQWVGDMLKAGSSPATVRKAYNAMAQMMRAAVADRRISFSPCVDVPLPIERSGEQRFLSPEEVATLADSITPRFRALVLVAAYGGLRLGELAGLRRTRVDLLRGTIAVAETAVDIHGDAVMFGEPKTPKSKRVVPLPRRIVNELSSHMDQYVDDSPDGLVFTGERGNPLRRSNFRQRVWIPATKAAGLEGLRIHDLRHTFVALWIAADRNPKEVSVAAGHTSVAFTLDRYGHLYEAHTDDIADRLDALLGDMRAVSSASVTRIGLT